MSEELRPEGAIALVIVALLPLQGVSYISPITHDDAMGWWIIALSGRNRLIAYNHYANNLRTSAKVVIFFYTSKYFFVFLRFCLHFSFKILIARSF